MEKPQTVNITGYPRELGSKASASERSEERVPAVLYGPTVAENVHFSVRLLDIERLLSVKNIQFVNIQLADGSSYITLLKKATFHPVTDKPLHIDFLVTNDTSPVTVVLPIRLVGTAPGVIEGGRLYQSVRSLKVKALPSALPSELTIHIGKMRMGQSLRVKNLQLEGLIPQIAPERTIVMVRSPKGGAKVAAPEEEPEEDGAPESESADA
jgi:large subunit ribosomal protein L25